MAAATKVSFTVRRPTPVSRGASSGPESDSSSSFKVPSLPRHLKLAGDSAPGSPLVRSATSSPRPTRAFHDSNDQSDEGEDDEPKDELLIGFDQLGVQKVTTPLVIPPLQDRDWREIARKRRTGAQFVPASATVPTGADGSVGGLGTKDTIGAGPVRGGLVLMKKKETVKDEMDVDLQVSKADPDLEPETEDQKAIRAILASANGELDHSDGPLIDIIPIPTSATPVSEADAFHQDMLDLPDATTLDAYARVPVSQFGAALLRGMGWKEGTAASLTGRGPVEPYLPEARPALLGMGAKVREEDLGEGRGKRPNKKYVPLIKREKEKGNEDDRGRESRDGSGRSSRRRTPESRHGSTPSSRRTSRSPPRKDRDRDRDKGGRRERYSNDVERERDRRKYDYDRGLRRNDS